MQKKQEAQKPNYSRIIFCICTIAVFIVTSGYLILSGFATQQEVHFGYKEGGDIDYSVKLKEGNFLEETELKSGDTYLAGLVEQIPAYYKYQANFTAPVSGDYAYQFVATIGAERDNGEKYWTKTYDLTEEKQASIDNSQKLVITEHVDIDYAQYAKYLEAFREEYGLAAKGTLKVTMLITGDFTTEIMDRPALLDSEISLSIPLAEESIDIIVETNTDNNGKVYTKYISVETGEHRFCRLAGLLLAVATIYLIGKLIVDGIVARRTHRYEYTVSKLREEYDNLIVDIDKAPKIKGLNVSTVKDFDELLDVYNTVKMPINFYEEDGESHFLIVSEKLAWQYVLRENDFIERPAKTKSKAKKKKTKQTRRRARK